jgi:hypothetical protein
MVSTSSPAKPWTPPRTDRKKRLQNSQPLEVRSERAGTPFSPRAIAAFVLYALLDRSTVVRVPHLAAALEVWRYCEDSCRFILGDSLGDATADTIRAALRRNPTGLTRSDISSLFDRHKSGGQVTRGLELLRSQKMAEFRSLPTRGRPAERWFPT